ncbi:MAG: trypsin-like serine protease, partial [Acidobacteria bacterium]|nr:trypsin-like serine protease [Acidobacteriota bacterium]
MNARFILLLAAGASLSAQSARPPGLARQMGRPAEHWLDPVTEAERKRELPKAGLTRASVHRGVPERFAAQGQWSRTAEGKLLFRAALRSPNARGLRLHFTDFDIAGGKVWLYPADNPEDGYFSGPYTGQGPFGDGEFWSDFVEGESVIVEYESNSEALPFRIDLASHVFVDVVPAKPSDSTTDRATALGPLPRAALGCHKDVLCFPEWNERARSVGRYLFETASGGALCSGAVVKTRNNSGIPYFLTADHCVSNQTEARSVQVFWGFTSVACGGAPRNLRQLPTTLGSTYMAGGSTEQGDFTLLRLDGQLPSTVTFSGWTPDEIGVGTSVTGIHHPAGDYQRISFGTRGDDIPSRGRPTRNYYTIVWREGITEGGSSGSPIFNDEGLIVGMLSAGPKPPAGKTECDFAPAFDFYGRFSTAYPTLQAFLEERTTGGGTPPPPPTTSGNTLTNNTPAAFRVGPFDGPTLLGENGTFKVEVPQGATRLEIRLRTTTPNADLDLFVRHGSAPDIEGGKVVSDHSSEGLDGNETIVITPQSNPPLRPGTYFATIAVFTPNVTAAGTVTAILTTGGGGVSTGGAQALTSGQTRSINIDAVANPVLLGGNLAYTIDVPQGATRLEIRLQTDNRNVDLDLFARFGQAVTLTNNR